MKKKSEKIVVIRTYSAGVHVGILIRKSGTTAVLADATRVWRWRGANTLSELSQQGASNEWTRISEMVPRIELTQVIEIIDCSDVAAINLRTPRWPTS